MKKLISFVTLVLIISFSMRAQETHEEIKQYVNFLNEQKTSAKDYVLSLFKNNDIVILCERDHRELTQYNLILEIIQDQYFIDNVGVVFTEVGARTLNPELNDFLGNGNLTDNEISQKTLHFQRNCTYAVWEKSNFSFLIKGIHNVNKNLSSNKKVKMYPTDVIYVEGEPTEEKIIDMLMKMEERDSLMGTFIIEKFKGMKNDNPKQKALVIMNFRHAYKEKTSDGISNVGMFLAEEYQGKVANVFINTYDTFKRDRALQDGKWDAAFKAANKEDVGFDFKDSPFGDYHFDHYPSETDKNYADMFDGFVFYQPIEKFQVAVGLSGFMDDGFFEKAVEEESLYNKVFSKLTKRDAPPVNEERLKYFNETHIEPLSNLDAIKGSIGKWLK